MPKNGKLLAPRPERVCSACDHSRRVAGELRCWFAPPQPCMLGVQPARLQGQAPMPIIRGIQTPTWPDYSCSHWVPMLPDHPDIGASAELPVPLPTHDAPTESQ